MRSEPETTGIKQQPRDRIRESFLTVQFTAGMKLAAASDIMDLIPVSACDPPDRYILRLHSRGLIRDNDGCVRAADQFDVGIWFHADYQRHADPKRVLTLLSPAATWHPNIRFPFICAGHITCATTITELIYQTWEILTYRNWAPHDGLHESACQWAREYQSMFPTDRRPLLRRTESTFDIQMIGNREGG